MFLGPDALPREDLEAVATRLWSAIEHWPPEKVCGGSTTDAVETNPSVGAGMCCHACSHVWGPHAQGPDVS